MILSIIAAMDKNRVIGKNNQLPWHLPADLRHFKTMTMDKPIIMGRKTYDSIGKPLPGRRNVVISHQPCLDIEGCEVFHSLQDALDTLSSVDEAVVIGGAMLFQEALPHAQRMYLTFIDQECDGDTFFPHWIEKRWQEVSSESHQPDEKNAFPYRFVMLARK